MAYITNRPKAVSERVAVFALGPKVRNGMFYSGERCQLFIDAAAIAHGYGAVLTPHEMQGHVRLLAAAWYHLEAGRLINEHRNMANIAGRKVTANMLQGFTLRGDYYFHDELVELAKFAGERDRRRIKRTSSQRLRFSILERDGFRCVYCGRGASTVELHVDHVVPVAKGGTHTADNLVASCFDCNAGKSDRPIAAEVRTEQ